MRVILDIKNDNIYQHLIYLLKNLPDVKVIEEEFKIDAKECLENLEKIKKGDVKEFKEVTPNELFEEIGI